MRRLWLLTFVVPLLAVPACQDATAPSPADPQIRVATRAPRALVTPSTTPQVGGGYGHTCALKTDGTVVCWGDKLAGAATVPVGLASVAQLSVGGWHTCALQTDGMMVCWGGANGYNEYGQATVPDGLASVAQVSAGYFHTCALKTDGTVVCWGYNENGQATVPGGLASVAQVSAGFGHTCALKVDGTVVCWGGISAPSGLASVAQVSTSYGHTCAVKTDETVVCWGGDNSYGQATVPDGLASIAQVSAGGYHTCALKTDGTVVCWGYNGDGETNVPDGLASVAQAGVGFVHSLALKTDGTVVCWGNHNGGRCDVPDGLNLGVQDNTPPVVTYTGNAGSYTVDQVVAITCTPSDDLSGIASSTCAAINGGAYSFSVGGNTYSATATDNVGNVGSATTTFTVTVTSGSLCNLVQRWVSNDGVANSMCVKLDQASYGVFRNELAAQSGKKISDANAAILLRLVNVLDP